MSLLSGTPSSPGKAGCSPRTWVLQGFRSSVWTRWKGPSSHQRAWPAGLQPLECEGGLHVGETPSWMSSASTSNDGSWFPEAHGGRLVQVTGWSCQDTYAAPTWSSVFFCPSSGNPLPCQVLLVQPRVPMAKKHGGSLRKWAPLSPPYSCGTHLAPGWSHWPGLPEGGDLNCGCEGLEPVG